MTERVPVGAPAPPVASGLGRAAVAEFLATAMLLIAVVGSGIMAAALSPTDPGLQLIESALSTGMLLAAIIVAFGPISGAHLNPAVTLADQLLGRAGWRRVGAYVAAQVSGAVIGVVIANVMFDLSAISIAATRRTGLGQWVGEAVATYGLVLLIFLMASRSESFGTIGAVVGAYIAAAYVFTSSTSFANPAVTVSRMLSDTFAGIAPVDVVPFIVVQIAATVLAVATIRLFTPTGADHS